MAQRVYTKQQLIDMVNQPRTEAEINWLLAYEKFCKVSVDWNRPIMITPFEGHYGYAGVVIAINGSPMHGTMLVKSSRIREREETTLSSNDKHDREVASMYVLHSEDTPKLVKSNRMRLKTSIHKTLWDATVNLLVDRGFLL